MYPLVNVYVAMENHHHFLFKVNQLEMGHIFNSKRLLEGIFTTNIHIHHQKKSENPHGCWLYPYENHHVFPTCSIFFKGVFYTERPCWNSLETSSRCGTGSGPLAVQTC